MKDREVDRRLELYAAIVGMLCCLPIEVARRAVEDFERLVRQGQIVQQPVVAPAGKK